MATNALPQCIYIPEAHYNKFMQEIKAIKPNKQKNWKNYLTDKWGTRSKCRYKDGKIYNWSLIASEWQQVFVIDWSKNVATSRLGLLLQAGVPADAAFGLEIGINHAC